MLSVCTFQRKPLFYRDLIDIMSLCLIICHTFYTFRILLYTRARRRPLCNRAHIITINDIKDDVSIVNEKFEKIEILFALVAVYIQHTGMLSLKNVDSELNGQLTHTDNTSVLITSCDRERGNRT
jgi:hypothetical protein